MGGKTPAAMAALLLAAMMPGCVSERDFEPIPSAGWQPGYTFHYSLEVDETVSGEVTVDGEPAPELMGQERDARTGPDPVYSYTVFNTKTEEDGVPLYLVMASAAGNSPSLRHRSDLPLSLYSQQPTVVAFRQSDLQPLQTSARLWSDEASLSVSATGTHATMRFPIERGDSWSARDREFLGTMTVTAEVGGMVQVEGPNGDVDAVHIEHVYEMEGEDAFVDAARAEAREEGIQVNSLDFEVSKEIHVYYAPSLHNVVRQEMVSRTYFQVDVIQDGQRFEGEMTQETTLVLTLTAVSLQQAPETSLEQALGGELLPPDPTIPPPEPPVADGNPGTMRLTASATAVNAAERPIVSFTASTTGTVSSFSYQVMDAGGTVVANGVGKEFDFEVVEPGTYTATLMARDGKGTALRSDATVYANYEAMVPASCPTLSGPGLNACLEAPVPVRPGLEALTVKAQRTPHAVESGSGELVLLDPEGNEWATAPMTGNEAEISISTPLPPGDYGLVYRPDYGVLEDVEYTITLRHA